MGLVNAVVDDVRAEARGLGGARSPATRRPPCRRPSGWRRSRARLSAAERAEIEAARAFVETKDDYKEGAAAFTGRR